MSIAHLYKSHVVPLLTTSSVIWRPFTQYQIDELERIQRQFSRYLSFKDGTPMQFSDHSYRYISQRFNIPTIRSRMMYNDALLAIKAKKGFINYCEI